MVRPSTTSSNNEVLDIIERYLNGEQDLTTLLLNSNDELRSKDSHIKKVKNNYKNIKR